MTFMWVLILALNCSSIMNSNKDEECETILDDRNEHSWSYKVAGGNGEKAFSETPCINIWGKALTKKGEKRRQTDKLWNQEWFQLSFCQSTRSNSWVSVYRPHSHLMYTGENLPHRWAAGMRISFACMTNLQMQITLVCRNASKMQQKCVRISTAWTLTWKKILCKNTFTSYNNT